MDRIKLNIQKFAGPTNINLGPNGEMFGHIRWDSTVQGSTAQEKAQLNKSKVNGYLYVIRTDGYTTWGDFTGSININGTTRNFSVNLSVGNSWVLVGQLTGVEVPHNADGSKSITISGSVTGPSGTTWAGKSVSGSATAVLDKIARYATSIQSLKSRTETSITMNWSSDNTCDYIWYSKNNGSSWTTVGSVNAKSGSYTISGLTANTTYNIKTRVRRKDSQLTTDSSNSAIATYNYPNCTSAPNFTIEDNTLTISLYNPLNRNVELQMYSYVGNVFINSTRLTTNVNGNYSFPVGNYINELYASIPNNKSSQYNIDVWYGSHKEIKGGGSYSVNETTSKPTFSNFEYEDVNSTTLALTGDSSVVVQNYSNIQATIPVENKAVAQNYATMKRYRIVIGEQTSDIDSNVIYKCSEANALLCTISGRKYYKATNDLAFVGYYYNGSYTGPILVGTTADSVKFTSDDTEYSGSTYTYQGQTYYVSSSAYFMAGNQTSTEGIAGKLSNSALTHEQAAEILLEKLVNDNEDIIIPAINNASSNIINVYAEDSRALATLVSKTATLKAYTNIQKNQINVERAGNVGTGVTLTYNGTLWGQNFGQVTNTAKSARYRFKKTSDSDYSGWNGTTTITPTTNGNNYSFSGGIAGDLGNTGFSAENSFNIEVEVFDELSSTVFSFTLGTGTPWIAVADEGIAIKAPYNENLGGKLQVNGYVIDKIGTLKQGFGDIFISDGTYTATLYTHLVGKYIGKGIWEIRFSGRIGISNSGSNYFNYGISIDKINTILGVNLKRLSTGVDQYSNLHVYNTSGNFDMVVIGYDTVLEYHSDMNRLMPARIYSTSGSIGGWPLNMFPNDCLITGTLYLKEQ